MLCGDKSLAGFCHLWEPTPTAANRNGLAFGRLAGDSTAFCRGNSRVWVTVGYPWARAR
jgi:hypothetical protein